MFRKLIAVAALALVAPAAAPAAPAFTLAVQAPDPLKQILEKNLELRRYEELDDLDDAEIARLIVLAEQDARELLATQGYFTPAIRITREAGTPPTVRVAVQPGPRTMVTAVDLGFEGDIATSTEPDAVAQREGIRRNWDLGVGQPFTQTTWDQAKSNAMRRLLARRYPAARTSYSLADIDGAAASAHLGLRLDSGPVFHLGELHVTGVQRYDPVLVPRLARLPVGMVYDQEKIVEAQLRLTGSGYFDSAFIFIDPESDPAAAPPQVSVREAPLQKMVLGLGFTTDGGPRATVEHTHNRLPGLGWRAVTKLQLERKNPYLQTEWTAIPDPGGWRWSTLARVERLDDDRLVTNSQRYRFGRFQLNDRIERNMFVQVERAQVENPREVVLTPLDTGAGSAVTANYIWTGRYFDSPQIPTRGYGVGVELGTGITLAGPHRPFQRGLVRWIGYHPFSRGKGRIQLRAEAGAVLAARDTRVPATALFRTGGDTTVRGYGYLDIGVPLPGGLVGPGRYMTVASAEYQRPVSWRGRLTAFEQTLFVDTGAVADHAGEMRPQVGIGSGLRWRSPAGPVEGALAYGVQAHRFRLHFSAGFVF